MDKPMTSVETSNSNMIARIVAVNRTRTPQEAFEATGPTQYAEREVVDTMPRGEGEEKEVFFFKLDRYVSDDDLDKEFELRGLKPADPYSLSAVNEADPAFADEHPNGTHWQDIKGRWCFATFDGWRDERRVHVGLGGVWRGPWWFAGVR